MGTVALHQYDDADLDRDIGALAWRKGRGKPENDSRSSCPMRRMPGN